LNRLAYALAQFGASQGWRWVTDIPDGPFTIEIRSATTSILILVTLLVLSLRYRKEQARQTAIEQNLVAARRMQEQLLASSETTCRI
jgi:hypothetical protein